MVFMTDRYLCQRSRGSGMGTVRMLNRSLFGLGEVILGLEVATFAVGVTALHTVISNCNNPPVPGQYSIVFLNGYRLEVFCQKVVLHNFKLSGSFWNRFKTILLDQEYLKKLIDFSIFFWLKNNFKKQIQMGFDKKNLNYWLFCKHSKKQWYM